MGICVGFSKQKPMAGCLCVDHPKACLADNAKRYEFDKRLFHLNKFSCLLFLVHAFLRFSVLAYQDLALRFTLLTLLSLCLILGLIVQSHLCAYVHNKAAIVSASISDDITLQCSYLGNRP